MAALVVDGGAGERLGAGPADDVDAEGGADEVGGVAALLAAGPDPGGPWNGGGPPGPGAEP